MSEGNFPSRYPTRLCFQLHGFIVHFHSALIWDRLRSAKAPRWVCRWKKWEQPLFALCVGKQVQRWCESLWREIVHVVVPPASQCHYMPDSPSLSLVDIQWYQQSFSGVTQPTLKNNWILCCSKQVRGVCQLILYVKILNISSLVLPQEWP